MTGINVAFTVDNHNLDQVAVVITSILAHSSEPSALRFFIVLDGPADVARQKIAGWPDRPGTLTLVPLDNRFAGRPQVGHISTAALLRTQLPNALPQLDRVLYLDADIIVRRDIAELYRSDLGDKPVGGVLDLGMYMRLRRESVHGDPALGDYFARLGLNLHQSPYVNSGVLLMDLAALRAFEFSARALAFSKARGAELITMDQCLINTLLSGRIALLDPRWNAFCHVLHQPRRHHYLPRRLRADLKLQQSEPWLVHYTGPNKPWNSAEVWRAADWWAYAETSGIGWPPAPTGGRRPSALASAWRSVTWGLSYALARVHPD